MFTAQPAIFSARGRNEQIIEIYGRLGRVADVAELSHAAIMATCITMMLAPTSATAEEFSGTVTRVTDGDTFHLSGVDPAIRVWGLDAPERDERGGSAATRAMRSLIGGQPLTCVLVDIDRYQRLVGQCFLPNGRDIAEAMISMGVATEYCRYSRGFYGNC